MDAVSAKLVEMGVDIIENDESIRVKRTGPLKCANVKTLPYPGFPTDLQPLIVALLASANGTSIVNEDVWENRFQYVGELRRMGANITVNGRVAVIQGTKHLVGCPITATDLRAGAAMVIAGLMADGETTVNENKYIDRGYEYFETKLRNLGADIERIETED